jgi:hypothetical protein
MKLSTSGFTGVNAPVLRKRHSRHVGGHAWGGKVAIMVRRF